ncbi:hypothetical protein SAMN05192583_1349 [Sphingomonas gellani]|uniref:Uncharacterized protein n=1 Tax=Sphingomonas gellani TaxID=1166340 RepID=A0A1H8BG10_9SPHN|nr:hypothetical protein [Sphingomonas gellani]SEM81696.1 hypothetical protein SAMN05192583_1349 [Sphingomonas gellani]
MDWKKLGLGLAAFGAGAAAWTVGVARFGPRRGSRRRYEADASQTTQAVKDGGDVVEGDSVTAPMNPRPATMAAAPVGMAETEKNLPREGSTAGEGHVPTDLLSESTPGAHNRVPEAFRPDPTAVPTAEEREALRPATGPAPTLAADRGSGFSEAAGAA